MFLIYLIIGMFLAFILVDVSIHIENYVKRNLQYSWAEISSKSRIFIKSHIEKMCEIKLTIKKPEVTT